MKAFALVAGVALLGLGAALAIAWATAREPTPGAPLTQAPAALQPPRSHDDERSLLEPSPPAVTPPAQAVPAPAPTRARSHATPARSPVTPSAVERVTGEARRQLESYKDLILSRCWPTAGLPGGRSSARLTLNVTFDAGGREIARGIVEDPRARAGPFARCLQSLPGTTLSVSAPGATVAIAMLLSYP